MIAIHARQLVQRYHDTKLGRERIILDHLNFDLRSGEFVSLVGPSGCGKSTLLRMILGSEKPRDGKLELFGAPPTEPDRDRGIVYQRYSLFPNLRVLENIIFGLELDEINFLDKYIWYPGFLKKHRRFLEQGREFLDRVGLAEHADKYPHQLSGGQQQRVAIAQALIMKPRVILMDEPFGALDPGTRSHLQEWLIDIHQREKTTIIFVTHDLEEAVYVSTRIIVLSQHFAKPGHEGARIVADLAPPAVPRKELRFHPDFERMVSTILKYGFEKTSTITPAEFLRTHPDSLPPDYDQ